MALFMIAVALKMDTLAGNPVSGAKSKHCELTSLTTSAVPWLAGLLCVRVLTLTLDTTHMACQPFQNFSSLFLATLL